MSAGVSQENPSESGHYTAVGTGCSVDLGHLEEMVSSLVNASIAPTTKRVYMPGQRKYLAFCESIQCQPLPMTED